PGLVKAGTVHLGGRRCQRRGDRPPAAGHDPIDGRKTGPQVVREFPHRLGRGEQALPLVAQGGGGTAGGDAAVARLRGLRGGTSGWVSSMRRTPSGAATRQRKRMRWAPACLSALTASAAEPPVASMGSSTKKSRASSPEGILK